MEDNVIGDERLTNPERILISPAEYLEREMKAEHRNEYLNGEIFAMAGASTSHTRICGNVHALLWNQLRGRPCEPMMSEQRVRTPGNDLYTYPDVLVTCEPELTADTFDTLSNPVVIFEVLSPSTQKFDRTTKFNRYKTIPSLRDYILVDQEQLALEHRSRYSGPGGEHWWIRILESEDDELVLDSISCRLKLSEIYERVQLETPQSSTD